MTNKNMLTSYFNAFRNFAIFEGRTNRFDYWSFILINLFLTLSLSSLPQLGGAYAILSILPALAITVRRLHDVNKSGWLILPLYLISGIGIISALSFFSNPLNFIIGISSSTFLQAFYWFLFVAFIAWAIYIFVLTCYASKEDNKYGQPEEVAEEEEKKAKSFIYTYIVTALILGSLFVSGAYIGYKSTQEKISAPYSMGYGVK